MASASGVSCCWTMASDSPDPRSELTCNLTQDVQHVFFSCRLYLLLIEDVSTAAVPGAVTLIHTGFRGVRWILPVPPRKERNSTTLAGRGATCANAANALLASRRRAYAPSARAPRPPECAASSAPPSQKIGHARAIQLWSCPPDGYRPRAPKPSSGACSRPDVRSVCEQSCLMCGVNGPFGSAQFRKRRLSDKPTVWLKTGRAALPRVGRFTSEWTCNAVSEQVLFGTDSKWCIRGRAVLDVFGANLSYPERMAVQWASKVEWEQLQSAFGDSREVGELLKLILVGEDVWRDLIGHVMHQGTIYEGTIAVAGWLVDALQTKRLDKRLIPVGKVFGRSDVLSERAIAFGVLSSMAEDARDALHSTSTPERYAALCGAAHWKHFGQAFRCMKPGPRIPTIRSTRRAPRCWMR